MHIRTRGLLAQIFIITILPLFVVLVTGAFGSVILHQNTMRTMLADRDGRAAAAVAAALAEHYQRTGSVQGMEPVLDALLTGPGTRVLLLDQTGKILYRGVGGGDTHNDQPTGENTALLITHPGVREALEGQTGSMYRADQPEDTEHVIVYAPVQPPGWALVMEEPWEYMTSPWLNTSLFAPLLLVPAVALSLLTIWFGIRRVIRPLQEIGVQAQALSRGDFKAFDQPVGGIEEVVMLQRTLARMGQQIQIYQHTLQDYVGAITHAQEEERKRLARELHDDTVQSLVALKQQAFKVDRVLRRQPQQAGEALATLQIMITQTLDEVRRFSRALRPIYLEESGLSQALETLARETGAYFTLVGDSYRLPDEVELAFYRIAQEALNNAKNHARARRIELTLAFTAEQVTLSVEDDGAGFPVPQSPAGLAQDGHFGLMGMQERAQLIGAELRIQSFPGAGTHVSLSLPHITGGR